MSARKGKKEGNRREKKTIAEYARKNEKNGKEREEKAKRGNI
jgi:hypothetical protein